MRNLTLALTTLGVLATASPAQACFNPAAAIPGVTSTGFYFLSQIGGCACLPGFLAQLPNTMHANATLVIDRACAVNQTLTLPRRMTLAGVGPEGQGVLSFPALGATQPAIVIGPQASPNQDAYVTIRDLNISGPGNMGYGLALDLGHQTHLDNVRLQGFNVGVFARSSYSVSIMRSSISNNRTNIRVGPDCNGWRLRDNVISRAVGYGVYVTAANEGGPALGSNDLLIDGNRFESNGLGAVRLGAFGAVLTHNRFESNNALGVRIEPTATSSRLLANYFSTDVVLNMGLDTMCQFSTGVIPGC